MPDEVKGRVVGMVEFVWEESADREREACARVIDGMTATIRGPAKTLLEIAARGIRMRKK